MSGSLHPNSSTDDYVVVAEDSAPNRRVLVLLLRRMGFQVLECENGAKAWQRLCESREMHVVAVISDLMMPETDGLELLRRVRTDEHFKALPFVLLTAVAEDDYISESKTLGVSGYLVKPLTYQRLLDKMKELFPQREFHSDGARKVS